MFGSLETAVKPREEETAIVVGGGLPENGVDPPVWLGLEDQLKPLLECWWWVFMG